MRNVFLIRLPLVIAACAWGAVSARADLLGDTVHVNYLYPDPASIYISFPHATVPANGAPFDIFKNNTFRVFPTMITLTNDDNVNHFFLDAVFNGFSLEDLSVPGKIVGATINPASNLAGFDASRISMSGTTLFVNFQGLTSLPTTYVQLDLILIPEPGAFALLAAGSGMSLLARRRRCAPRLSDVRPVVSEKITP